MRAPSPAKVGNPWIAKSRRPTRSALGPNPAPRLPFQACSDRVELPGGAELFVLVRDEFGVFLDEDLAGRAEIEFGWLVPEILAMDAGPDEAAISIDVHLGYAQLGGWEVFLLVHSA